MLMSKKSSDQSPEISFRENCFRRAMSSNCYDVLILGGGVNGVATLRDLSLNNISALLIDENDFCIGASSASSRMAHGGLRYLEGREFRLVKESARERNLLLKNAHHLVKPLKITVPVQTYIKGLMRSSFRFLRLSKRSGVLSLATLIGALTLYDFMGRVQRALPRFNVSFNLNHSYPKIKTGTKALVTYFDGLIRSPEGLIMEMLNESVQINSTNAALNHVSWTMDDGDFVIKDKYSDSSVRIKPKVIVNATGSAIDKVNTQLGIQTAYIRGVKGTHLILKNSKLSERIGDSAFYYDDGTGRMVIMIPINDTVLMGTTEVDLQTESDIQITHDEIDYLLASASLLFEDVEVTKNDIVAVTTGIRPLQNGNGGDANAALRDHKILKDVMPSTAKTPVLSLVGGKWTTFRAFGEDTSTQIHQILNKARTVDTTNLVYPGSIDKPTSYDNKPDLVKQKITKSNLPDARMTQLFQRYGTVANHVATYCSMQSDAALKTFPNYSIREIEWLVLNRAACNLDDLLLRRTNLILTGKVNFATLEEIASIMSRILQKSKDWEDKQLEHCASLKTIIYKQVSDD